MTREEAVEAIECNRPTSGYQMLREALDITISALREQEERERGCEYCTDSKSIYHLKSGIHDSMDEDVYISGNALVVDIGCRSYGSCVVNFCPMCGRRLHLPKPTTSEANS